MTGAQATSRGVGVCFREGSAAGLGQAAPRQRRRHRGTPEGHGQLPQGGELTPRVRLTDAPRRPWCLTSTTFAGFADYSCRFTSCS